MSVGRMRGFATISAALAALALAATPAWAKGKLASAKTGSVDGEITFEGPGEKLLRIECPKGHFVSAVHRLTARRTVAELGFSPLVENPDLRIVRQEDFEDAVEFTIESSKEVDQIDNHLFEVRGRIECVKEKVKGRGVVAAFELFDLVFGGTAIGAGARATVDLECPGAVPVGWRMDQAGLEFETEEYLRKLEAERGRYFVEWGNPASVPQDLQAAATCIETGAGGRRSSAGSSDRRAASRAKTNAKPKVFAAAKQHKVDPHPSVDERDSLAVKCPKDTSATSFGWDANDADGVDVFLRGFELDGRRAIVDATNFGADPQTVTVTAICLAMKFSG